MIKLYDVERSGNCYKIRLMLAVLGIEYQKIPVNAAEKGEQKRAAFLKLNPRGQVPVLDDDEVIVWDTTAILVYLGRKFGGDYWLPMAPHAAARVMQWLAMAQDEIRYGLTRARSVRAYAARKPKKIPTLFARQGNLDEAQALGREALRVLEHRLSNRAWLAADHPTIGDIACYPYTALAPQGGLPLQEYPGIRAWLTRIQSLPGYVDHAEIPRLPAVAPSP